MPGKPYLICLRKPDEEVLEAIRAEWPDENCVELNETQFLIAHTNGGTSVYDLLEKRLPGKTFKALIIRVGEAYHGYESRSVWEWLRERV